LAIWEKAGLNIWDDDNILGARMADNQWGKSPPKKKEYTPPELGTPSFWGPAPVPPKVFQTWENVWGESTDGKPYEDPEGLEDGADPDSWVSRFSKRFDTPDSTIKGEGRDGDSSDSPDGKGGADPDSWVTGFEKELAENTSSSSSDFSKNMTSNPFSVSGDGRDGEDGSRPDIVARSSDPFRQPQSKVPPGQAPPTVGGGSSVRPESWVNNFQKQTSTNTGSTWRSPVPQTPQSFSSSFTPGAAPTESSKPDKFVGQWNFRVAINGIPDDNCKLLSISGISSETEPIEFKRSTRQYMESIPGRIKYSDIEITKVLNIGGDSFARWREEIEAGLDSFRTITVYLHHIDLKGTPVMTLTLHDAWPVKWEFPELSGSSSDAAVEKITLDIAQMTRG
jgi:phage tail-like protein